MITNENKWVEVVFYKEFTIKDIKRIEKMTEELAKEINAEVHSRMSKTLRECLK